MYTLNPNIQLLFKQLCTHTKIILYPYFWLAVVCLWVVRLWLPLLAHCCFIVSISTPESLAFRMADVARGQPDRLEAKKQEEDEDLQNYSRVPYCSRKWKNKIWELIFNITQVLNSLVLCLPVHFNVDLFYHGLGDF